MRRGILLLVCAGLAAASPAEANFGSAADATMQADFLNLGAGARAAGMGGAYSAVADDATALYWNPAALTQIKSHDAAFMHAPYFAGSFFDYGAYGQNLGRWGAFGLGLEYFSAGSITQTQNSQALGTYSPYYLAASVCYAYTLKNSGFAALDDFSFGLAAKYIRAEILTTASAAAVDWGVLSPAYADDKLRLALTMSNLGSAIKFDQAAEPLPLIMRLGGAYKVMESWLVSVNVDFPKEASPYGAIGAEHVLPPAGAWRLAVRGGFNSQTTSGGNIVSGATFGFGLGKDQLTFDYGFTPAASLGFSQRLSLGFKWGDKTPEKRAPRVSDNGDKRQKTAGVSSAYLTSAANFIGLGAMEEAKEELARADQSMGPQDLRRIRYYQLRGAVAFAQNDVSGAKAFYVKGLVLARARQIEDFYTVEAYVGLGKCLMREGNKEAARKVFQKAYHIASSPEIRRLLEDADGVH